MSTLSQRIVQNDPHLQKLMEKAQKAPSLPFIVLAIIELLRIVAVQLIEDILNERGQAPEEECPLCPICGAKLESKGLRCRELLTLVGLIKWKRRIRRCPNGCKGSQVAPSDEALGLEPHQKTSQEVKRLATLLALFVSFETAAKLLESLTGVKVSAKSIWNWVQESGQKAMEQLSAELTALGNGELPEIEACNSLMNSLLLLIGADGVMVAFRGKGKSIWKEVKVGVVAYLQKQVDGSSQLLQRRLVAVLGSISDLEPRLRLEAMKQGLEKAERVAWLSDGGVGFWGLYNRHFARYAVGILDFYHAAQNLWKGAKAWLDGRTTEAKKWFKKNRGRLRQGEQDQVLSDIEAALELDELPASTYQTLENLYAYLETHREHIDYKRFEELGLPLGSGMVESACKWLIQQRFKGVGMRWSEDGFNHLLHLRLAWVNGRFDQLFSF